MTELEALLLWAEELPAPGVWLPLQGIAVLAASLCFFCEARDPKLKRYFVLALPFGLAGALLLGALFRWLDYLFFEGPADFVGVALFGALGGVVLAFAVLVRHGGFSVADALDRLAIPLLCLVGVGRLGCFLAGCDAGVVSGSVFALRFPAGTQVFRDQVAQGLVLRGDDWSLAVHPAQLYEAGLALLLAVGTRFVRAKDANERRGAAFCFALAGYAVARVCVDTVRPTPSFMTYGQWSAAALLVGLFGWVMLSAPHAPYAARPGRGKPIPHPRSF